MEYYILHFFTSNHIVINICYCLLSLYKTLIKTKRHITKLTNIETIGVIMKQKKLILKIEHPMTLMN